MLDADRLKQVNDNFGHAEGDRLLQNIAFVLRKEFRNDDIVARFGGDEFAVFAPGLQDAEEIQRRAERINKFGRHTYQTPNDTTISTSLSIGISRYPLHGEKLGELLRNADKALYSVKAASRDSYKIFE